MKIKFGTLMSRRRKRLPGYVLKYVYGEYWKVILRFLALRDNRLFTFTHDNNIFLNIDPTSLKIIIRIYELDDKNIQYWGTMRKNAYSLLGIYLPILLRPIIRTYQKIVLTTDINIVNYNTIKHSSATTQKICIQHGYFPANNTMDIDGLNTDHYIVRSISQKTILRQAGYIGTVDVIPFNQKVITKPTKVSTLIFVGPGFEHNKDLENIILRILLIILELNYYKILYRPHPRCSRYIISKLQDLGVQIDTSAKTAVSNNHRQFFVGVKSTMLIDAEEIGHEVLLIEDPLLPKYFPKGDLKNVSDIDSLKTKLR